MNEKMTKIENKIKGQLLFCYHYLMIKDIILQVKLNALKLDERLHIEDLEDRIWKLKKSIDLLDDQLDRIYLD